MKSRKNYYAVRIGRNTGVYNSWCNFLACLVCYIKYNSVLRSECEAQVKKYPGAVFKGFHSHSEADSFANASGGYRDTSNHSRAHVSNARQRYSGNFVGGSNR